MYHNVLSTNTSPAWALFQDLLEIVEAAIDNPVPVHIVRAVFEIAGRNMEEAIEAIIGQEMDDSDFDNTDLNRL